MKHAHKYETLSHPGVSSEIAELGIQAAEIRRCSKCEQQAIFVQTRKGRWVPLFAEPESGEVNILLS